MPRPNGNLYNYFKPFSVPDKLQKKRPLSAITHQEQPAVKRSPLNSPKDEQQLGYQGEAASQTKDSVVDALGSSRIDHTCQQESLMISQDAERDQAPPTPTLDNTTARGESHIDNTTPMQYDITSRTLAVTGPQTIFSSSQRVVKNGEVMIRNSDDESFSDSSLEDIDDLLRRKCSRESSPSPEPRFPQPTSENKSNDDVDSNAKRKTRKSARTEKQAAPLTSTLPVIPKTYKYSLASLVKQRKQHEASNEGLARATSMLQSYDERKASGGDMGRLLQNKGTFEDDLINIVMKDDEDEDDAGRLKTAIQRTEALQQSKSWSFFDNRPDAALVKRANFPAVEDERLRPFLTQAASRQQAFVSGYVGEYSTKTSLPEEIILWILDEVCLESRDDLRYSYTNTLVGAAAQISSLLTPKRIDTLFRKLGATVEALSIEQPVVPRSVLSQSIEYTSRPGLLSILDLLGSLASDLAAECRMHVSCTLCRLALDYSIIKDYNAMNAIGRLLSSLMGSIAEEDLDHEIKTLVATVFHSVRDASLRLQLLQMIPPLPPRLARFRQWLALTFFFQDSQYMSKYTEDWIDLRSMADRLRSPQFAINNATDYADLAASIGILSIAIDSGNPPPPGSSKEDEIAFNSDVDILALKIRAMFTQIIDTSASQMKRTEAKEILEGFHARLWYAIRTKPPPKKSIFGDSHVKPLQERMEAFVVRRKQDDEAALTNGT